MLKINSLNFNIKERTLFKSLGLHLKEGENLTILGENGSGKSTLAKILCGLIKSDKEVLLEGTFIEEIAAKKRATLINYMPSKFSLYDPYITLKEYLHLSLYQRKAKEEKIQDVLTHLQLTQHQDAYAQSLSSGEQQLLLLASCMIQESDITVLDEPTSNLDPKKTKLIFDILSSDMHLKQKILITHDLQLAHKLNFPVLYIEESKTSYFKDDFFTETNLKKYFGTTIMIVDDNIVETL